MKEQYCSDKIHLVYKLTVIMQTSQRCKCEQIIIFSKIPNKKMGRDSKLKQNRVFFNFKKMES